MSENKNRMYRVDQRIETEYDTFEDHEEAFDKAFGDVKFLRAHIMRLEVVKEVAKELLNATSRDKTVWRERVKLNTALAAALSELEGES